MKLKGENTMMLNAESVREAMQGYINRLFVVPPTVKCVDVEGDRYNGYQFVITLDAPADTLEQTANKDGMVTAQ